MVVIRVPARKLIIYAFKIYLAFNGLAAPLEI